MPKTHMATWGHKTGLTWNQFWRPTHKDITKFEMDWMISFRNIGFRNRHGSYFATRGAKLRQGGPQANQSCTLT